MQFIVYTRKGDVNSSAIIGQIRALLGCRMINAQVQLMDDPVLLSMNGITQTPTVMLDGSFICSGYMPSRTELEMAIDRRENALSFSRSAFEHRDDNRPWR